MLIHSLRRSLPSKLAPVPRKISTSALVGSSRRNLTPVPYPTGNPNIYTGLLRFKSTKTVNTAAGSSSATPANNVAGNAPTPATEGTSVRRASPTPRLTWPEYLLIRKSKRKWQTYASIPSSALGLFAGAMYFGSLDTDPMKPIMGIDPFMFYGICTTACMAAGYIVGPTLGTIIWRALPSTKRAGLNVVDAMDKEFYERIARNRVDVTLQSPTSPVPDYYGERIGSLHQYRQWLRDQNKYRRKVVFDEQGQ